MDVVKFLERTNQNVAQMKLDILNWANGINNDDGIGNTFWQRNKTKLYTTVLLGGSTGLFYVLGFNTLYRIMGLFFILFIIGNSITLIKGGLKWIRSKL